MCGIVGMLCSLEKEYRVKDLKEIVTETLLASQSRGKDSSGIAFNLERGGIRILKDAITASQFVKSNSYDNLWDLVEKESSKRLSVIAHTRMETHGSFATPSNNAPIVRDGIVLVHNGIIVNYKELWESEFQGSTPQTDVDSEILNRGLSKLLLSNKIESFYSNIPGKFQVEINEIISSFKLLKGSYNMMAFLDFSDEMILATNTGSLYELSGLGGDFFLWASEYQFLESILKKYKTKIGDSLFIKKISVPSVQVINIKNFNRFSISLNAEKSTEKSTSVAFNRLEVPKQITLLSSTSIASSSDFSTRLSHNLLNKKKNESNLGRVEKIIELEFAKNRQKIDHLRRCTKCILPETMPYIVFDSEGVCSYCHNHQKRETRGVMSLHEELKKYRRRKDRPDAIVSFSGGRDSSYALHYIKKELGFNPIAYSYDWGMLTDLGRRNQARMTGSLNVEHILVSADIQKKRHYIKLNWEAWLKNPHIGMVPLFMAGDKQYFYYLNKLRKDTGIDLVFYADNALEKTDFKYGFAGVKLDSAVGKAYKIGVGPSLKLLSFYGNQYVTNKGYLNESLLDTFSAYLSSYVIPKDYLYLFRYILWNEGEVEKTLRNEYDWELAPDTKSSWRIGDGTAAIYNYIYYTVAGLTEHDTFRSNQIREGDIKREDALLLAAKGNLPRLESLLWYADTVSIDLLEIILKIHQMKKYYH